MNATKQRSDAETGFSGLVVTADDVQADLEAGRSQPRRRPDDPIDLRSPGRPTLGGHTFRRTFAAAVTAGRIHPRLARRALLRLWLTPWVHPSALRPVTDVPAGLRDWSLPVAAGTLRGFAGGHGETVVLVHGWAGRAADWRHLAGDLIAAGRRVVAPDLLAHGRSPGVRTDLFDLADSLVAVLDHERPDAMVVHSMGFPVTLLAAERGAELPERLAALAPGRRISHAVDGFVASARFRPALATELRRGIEARFGADVWEVLDVERSLPRLASTGGLVVHDRDDEDIPLVDAQAIASGWQCAHVEVTSGLGHRRILRDRHVRARVVDAVA